MSISEQDVTIRLQHELDDLGQYRSMDTVKVDIFVHGKAAGTIQGTMIHRNPIPKGTFFSVMDDQSADLQYAAFNLFEPRGGRTKLRSILEGLEDQASDVEYGFLYIKSIQVNPEYATNASSDVGTYALRKLMHHPYITGSVGHVTGGGEWWGTGVCCYILESTSMREQNSAIQFLRNGFFQDRALVNKGCDRFLVAAHDHWTKPLKSHSETSAMPFLLTPSKTPPPRGKDGEIRQIIEQACLSYRNGNGDSSYQAEITRLVGEGGSLTRAMALHVACASHDHASMVDFILRTDPSTLESRDETQTTPLMIAAGAAAAVGNLNRVISRDQPVIDMLLAAGARKDAVNFEGMTSYGILMQVHKQLTPAVQAMMGFPVSGGDRSNSPELDLLKSKLMPPGGPTTADLKGGIRDGFVDYSQIDAEFDEEPLPRYEYVDDVRGLAF